MRKPGPWLVVVVVLGFAGTARAQEEYPRGEVFGGFSVYDSNTNVYGWQASAAVNVSPHIGFVADFGGHYDATMGNSHEYLFGPRFRTSRARVVGFGHALFGAQRLGASGISIDSFAMGFGGGVDLVTDSGIGFRLAQVDWIPIRVAGTWFKQNYRYGIGIVIPLGN